MSARIYKYVLLAILGGVCGGVMLSDVRTQPAATDDVRAQLPALLAGLDQRMAWTNQERKSISRNGMEPASAGFHLLRPPSDPYYQNAEIYGWQMLSSYHAFWEIEAAYPNGSYVVTDGGDLGPVASFKRQVDNGLISSATAVFDPGTNAYSVVVSFDQLSIEIMKGMIERTSPGPSYIDWYGNEIPAGSPPTEMRVVLVSDNIAYQPISITDIVLGQTSQPIVVAHGLTQSLADKLVQRLGF